MVSINPKSPLGNNPRVLSAKECKRLLADCDAYMNGAMNRIGDRHMAELLAEGMIREGCTTLASKVLLLHDEIRSFYEGHFENVASFNSTDIVQDMVYKASNTKFLEGVEALGQSVTSFSDIISRRGADGIDIDWNNSAKILNKIRREQYPHMLSMVERIDNWQAEQGNQHPSRA